MISNSIDSVKETESGEEEEDDDVEEDKMEKNGEENDMDNAYKVVQSGNRNQGIGESGE